MYALDILLRVALDILLRAAITWASEGFWPFEEGQNSTESFHVISPINGSEDHKICI